MTQPRPRRARTLGAVLTTAHDRAEKDRGKKISFGELSRYARDEHRVEATDETIRSYHNDTGGEKKNPLLIAALAAYYELKLSDLPAEEAARIVNALQLLKRVTAGSRTPPGTRTRNLQNKGRHHPASPTFTPKPEITQVSTAA
jgi:hypothetical protein